MEQRPTTYITSNPITTAPVQVGTNRAPVMQNRVASRPAGYSASPIRYGTSNNVGSYRPGVNYPNQNRVGTLPSRVPVASAPIYQAPIHTNTAPRYANPPIARTIAPTNPVPVYNTVAPVQNYRPAPVPVQTTAPYHPGSVVYNNNPHYRNPTPVVTAPVIAHPHPVAHYPQPVYNHRPPVYNNYPVNHAPILTRSVTPPVGPIQRSDGYTVEEREYIDYGDGRKVELKDYDRDGYFDEHIDYDGDGITDEIRTKRY